MGLIQNFLNKRKRDREEFRNLQKQKRSGEILVERDKSANEREVERFVKTEREKQIKDTLERFRQIEKEELKQTNALNAPNVIKDNNEILGTPSIFNRRSSILDQSSLFSTERSFLMR